MASAFKIAPNAHVNHKYSVKPSAACLFSVIPPDFFAQALEDLLVRMTDLNGALNDGVRGDDSVPCSGLDLVNTTSVQLARYPGDGRGYVRHRDTPKTAQDNEEAERKVPPNTAPANQVLLLLLSCVLCFAAIQAVRACQPPHLLAPTQPRLNDRHFICLFRWGFPSMFSLSPPPLPN